MTLVLDLAPPALRGCLWWSGRQHRFKVFSVLGGRRWGRCLPRGVGSILWCCWTWFCPGFCVFTVDCRFSVIDVTLLVCGSVVRYQACSAAQVSMADSPVLSTVPFCGRPAAVSSDIEISPKPLPSPIRAAVEELREFAPASASPVQSPVAALTASFSEAMAAPDEEFPDGNHQVPTGTAEDDDLLADKEEDPNRLMIDESWKDSNVAADAEGLAIVAEDAAEEELP